MPASDLSKADPVFASEVRAGLLREDQKELPSRYFYDALGSALFEAITLLSEYGLTQADDRLLAAHAVEIASLLPAPVAVVELGSGDGHKARPILEALGAGVRYSPVDVSELALVRSRQELESVARVVPIRGDYLSGLQQAVQSREGDQTLLVLFLGSNFGNFERACGREFLAGVRARLRAGDALLLGVDLVKNADRMVLAYDDPAGVTAAFNLNILGRINRELGGDFNLRQFAHEARYNAAERRIEMHLRSRAAQTVHIAAADCTVSLKAGETIWTESSHKFTPEELGRLCAECGFRSAARWIDAEWPFAEELWIAE